MSRCSGEVGGACYNLFDIRNTGDYTYINEADVNSSWAKLACTEGLVCDYVDAVNVSINMHKASFV